MIAFMKQILVWYSLIALAFGAEDAWTKVKELKSGSEVRILKVGSKEAVIGKFDEADEERLVLVVKNTQIAIAKGDVISLEARPMAASKVMTVTHMKNTDPAAELAKPKVPDPSSPATPALSSSSSTVSFGSKPGYELVYRKGGR